MTLFRCHGWRRSFTPQIARGVSCQTPHFTALFSAFFAWRLPLPFWTSDIPRLPVHISTRHTYVTDTKSASTGRVESVTSDRFSPEVALTGQAEKCLEGTSRWSYGVCERYAVMVD